jgi:hypothetical protein
LDWLKKLLETFCWYTMDTFLRYITTIIYELKNQLIDYPMRQWIKRLKNTNMTNIRNKLNWNVLMKNIVTKRSIKINMTTFPTYKVKMKRPKKRIQFLTYISTLTQIVEPIEKPSFKMVTFNGNKRIRILMKCQRITLMIL